MKKKLLGDSGKTSHGIHGIEKKAHERMELLGNLDLLRTYSFNLKDKPKWLDSLLTNMLISMVTAQKLNTPEIIPLLDKHLKELQKKTNQKSWFFPSKKESHEWDMFRVYIRQTELIAWKNEQDKNAVAIAQVLNHLADYAFYKAVLLNGK